GRGRASARDGVVRRSGELRALHRARARNPQGVVIAQERNLRARIPFARRSLKRGRIRGRDVGLTYLDAAELLAHELRDDAGIRLPLRLLHHLSDEEAEETLLSAAVGGDLVGVLLEDPVDDGADLSGIRHRLVRQIGLPCESRLAKL